MNLTYIKNNWISILLLLVFLWVIFKPSGCGPDLSWEKKPTIDTTTKTVYITQPTQVVPMYIPQQTGSTSYPIVIPADRQGSNDFATLQKQYNDLIREFLAKRTYKDSIQLKDTAGNRVGVVNLHDEVSENELKTRQPSYQLSFPHTTTTITIREPYQPKRQLYGGVNLAGTPSQIVNGADLGVMYKDKKDNMWKVEVGGRAFGSTIQPNFEIGRYWKLSLGKK